MHLVIQSDLQQRLLRHTLKNVYYLQSDIGILKIKDIQNNIGTINIKLRVNTNILILSLLLVVCQK